MSVTEAIILGIIQGLTEFLPVSSSGHLELAQALFGNQNKTDENLIFTIVVHGATALATLVVFRDDVWEIIRDLFRFSNNKSTKSTTYDHLLTVSNTHLRPHETKIPL